jgi:hypothetical protein
MLGYLNVMFGLDPFLVKSNSLQNLPFLHAQMYQTTNIYIYYLDVYASCGKNQGSSYNIIVLCELRLLERSVEILVLRAATASCAGCEEKN